MSSDYILHESSIGYAIFKVVHPPDTIAANTADYQRKLADLSLFGKMVSVSGFAPFHGAQHALENINDISEGILPSYLHETLSTNLPQADAKHSVKLGVADKELAASIKEAFPRLECSTAATSKTTADLLRGVRLHADKLLKQIRTGDFERAQLGLGHSYSRAKVKFNVNRNDNHVIQAIATLDHLDKAVNQFSMRVREWYSWHFPELIRLVSENYTYARLALYIGDKKTLLALDAGERLSSLTEIVGEDPGIARSIIDAARVSMGQDFAAVDMAHVQQFAQRVVNLTQYRKQLSNYLIDKMGSVAPNLATLIGDMVAARLISHAGSLTSLAKYPASTLQILGAEKALFRALKTKTNTPKYGLIYHSSFIGRAGLRNKGRISRFLANKCSIASRIDNFSENPGTRFGDALRRQVEERLAFYAEGKKPMKNVEAMRLAMVEDDVLGAMQVDGPAATNGDVEMAGIDVDALEGAGMSKAQKKRAKEEKKRLKEEKKLAKKAKKGDVDGAEGGKKRKHVEVNGDAGAEAGAEEKKKKKREKHRHGK